MTHMLDPRPSRHLWIALMVGVLTAAACDDDPKEPPASFQAACGGIDAGDCVEPFQCFSVPDSDSHAVERDICTIECEEMADCPGWENPRGHHCAGWFQTLCINGYCQGQCA
jgi:hypothetical protein